MGAAPQARRARFALAALAVIAVIAAACGPSSAGLARASDPMSSPDRSSPGVPYVPARSRDAEAKRLAVTLDGETIYLRNGGQVVLGDGLAVEIFIDPYPPSVLDPTIDVYLTRDGRGLTDGGVELAYDMLAMGHGPFAAEARKIGGGHYLVRLDYIMFGPWEQVVTIRIGLQRIRLPVVVVAYP